MDPSSRLIEEQSAPSDTQGTSFVNNPFFNPKVHREMIIGLGALLLCELLLLCGSIVYKKKQNKAFEISVSFALASLYLLLMVIYIPLFSTIMERLRVAFPITHKNIRSKVTIGFLVLMLLLLTRYLIYLAF